MKLFKEMSNFELSNYYFNNLKYNETKQEIKKFYIEVDKRRGFMTRSEWLNFNY